MPLVVKNVKNNYFYNLIFLFANKPIFGKNIFFFFTAEICCRFPPSPNVQKALCITVFSQSLCGLPTSIFPCIRPPITVSVFLYILREERLRKVGIARCLFFFSVFISKPFSLARFF